MLFRISNRVVGLAFGPGGSASNVLTLSGLPGYEYRVQFATNLPGTPWFDLATNIAGPDGLWNAVDLTATNDARFYRLKY